MPVDLTKPLSWETADAEETEMLENLQGNILKGHGRDHTVNIFFVIDKKRRQQALRALRDLANDHLTNAHQQLIDAKSFKSTGVNDKVFVHLALSAAGYKAIGQQASAPDGTDFAAGMRAGIGSLHDGPLEQWEPHFRHDVHGLAIVGHDRQEKAAEAADTVRDILVAGGCSVVAAQAGSVLRSKAGEGIEHFGYVDGRSQPLVLGEDVAEEAGPAGFTRWDPTFPLDIALVKDPGTADTTSFGSYLVFRKLEQDVRGFKTREQVIAEALVPGNRELAGALIVGRFEDGTPVTASATATGAKPPNDFDYADDDAGSKCPVQGHIRKTNPRGSGGAERPEVERRHLMIRRGIPYEDVKREVPPSDVPDSDSLEEFLEKVAPKLPTGDVGLLFMAYNSDIGNQFKFTQQVWANNANFPLTVPGARHGIDPVIGQGPNLAGHQKLPKQWGDPAAGVRDDLPFAGFVTMRGGEYFFSPSLTFLRGLGEAAA